MPCVGTSQERAGGVDTRRLGGSRAEGCSALRGRAQHTLTQGLRWAGQGLLAAEAHGAVASLLKWWRSGFFLPTAQSVIHSAQLLHRSKHSDGQHSSPSYQTLTLCGKSAYPTYLGLVWHMHHLTRAWAVPTYSCEISGGGQGVSAPGAVCYFAGCLPGVWVDSTQSALGITCAEQLLGGGGSLWHIPFAECKQCKELPVSSAGWPAVSQP